MFHMPLHLLIEGELLKYSGRARRTQATQLSHVPKQLISTISSSSDSLIACSQWRLLDTFVFRGVLSNLNYRKVFSFRKLEWNELLLGVECFICVWSLTLQTKITGLAMDMQVSVPWNSLAFHVFQTYC